MRSKIILTDRSGHESGQAVVEYLLGMVTALAIVAILSVGLKKSVVRLWVTYNKEISAACPHCKAAPEVTAR